MPCQKKVNCSQTQYVPNLHQKHHSDVIFILCTFTNLLENMVVA